MEGVTQLVGALEKVRTNLSFDSVAEVTLAACKPTAEVIRAITPRRTGALANGIDARLLDGSGVVVVAIGPHKDSFYAPFVEFGTAKNRPNAFLRPGFDSDEDQLKQRLRDGLGARMVQGVAA